MLADDDDGDGDDCRLEEQLSEADAENVAAQTQSAEVTHQLQVTATLTCQVLFDGLQILRDVPHSEDCQAIKLEHQRCKVFLPCANDWGPRVPNVAEPEGLFELHRSRCHYVFGGSFLQPALSLAPLTWELAPRLLCTVRIGVFWTLFSTKLSCHAVCYLFSRARYHCMCNQVLKIPFEKQFYIVLHCLAEGKRLKPWPLLLETIEKQFCIVHAVQAELEGFEPLTSGVGTIVYH